MFSPWHTPLFSILARRKQTGTLKQGKVIRDVGSLEEKFTWIYQTNLINQPEIPLYPLSYLKADDKFQNEYDLLQGHR